MTTTFRENAEAVLGPAEKFILTNGNWQLCRRWAILCGYLEPNATATGADLANLYHQYGPKSKPDPMGNHAAFAALVQAVADTGFAPLDVAKVEQIARETVDADRAVLLEIMSQEIVNRIADQVKPPPLVIEIRRPDGVVQLDGLQHEATAEVIETAGLGDPIMMVGPAGCGKTTIGEATAKALGLPFFITSTVFDTHELMGFVDGHGAYHPTPFRQAFQNGGVWVADEIDAWDAAALLAANSALAQGLVTFPDSTMPVRVHPDFRMIATANTFGKGADRVYVGRNELDAASLDRFAVIEVDYDPNLETHLCGTQIDWYLYVSRVRAAVREKNIRHVVSTRAVVKGARALTAGRPLDRVREIYLWKGLSASDRKKLEHVA